MVCDREKSGDWTMADFLEGKKLAIDFAKESEAEEWIDEQLPSHRF
jgi:hypothetical protein